VPEPCGGDLVGSWQGVDACLTEGPQSLGVDGCPEAKYEIVSASGAESVTQTFDADGTFTTTGSVDALVEYRIPLECITTCADAEAAVEQSEGIELTCTTTAELCKCTSTLTIDMSSQGTYSVSGTKLTTVYDDGDSTDTDDFCVQGNQVTFVDDVGAVILKKL
jgi:hypothetical protein